jgi:hypothetical protein
VWLDAEMEKVRLSLFGTKAAIYTMAAFLVVFSIKSAIRFISYLQQRWDNDSRRQFQLAFIFES